MTTTKVFLWDADGVTLKRQAEYFSVIFAREYGAPLDELTQFMRTTLPQCQLGKSGLIEELSLRLPAWGWKDGVSKFLEYWFSRDIADEAVLAKVQDLRSRGIKCCLVTDQELHRATYIKQNLGFGKKFDQCFFSCDLGKSKEDPAFFTEVLKRLPEVAPNEVQYWDDDEKNVAAAKSVGIDARFYKSFDDIGIL